MTRKLVVIPFVSLFSLSSVAENAASPDMLQLLQEDMQEYSRLATQTRQNVDFMPYIISAWSSDELNILGISTLREALSLVPGVDLSIGTVGVTTPIFRGSNPFAMGQSKLVIDGVVVNDKMTGSYNQFLDLPVDMIHRIEVVRGPGSALSYVNSYAGSIHVITKANRDDGVATENEVYAEIGSDQYKTGGFVVTHQENDLSITSDLFFKSHDQSSPVTLDRYGNSGQSYQWLDNYSLGFNVKYKKLSIKSRLSDKESGPSYGQSFSLSEDESDFANIENNFIEFEYSEVLAKDIKINFSLGFVELDRELQNKVIPDGGSMGPLVFVDGRYFLVDIEEETFYERIELQIDSIDSHKIKLGVHANQIDMAKTDGRASTDDMQTFSLFDVLQNTPRKMYSLYIDDLIDITERTSMQLGIKYDHYSDIDNQTSPRLALVHRYDNANIYKFMYSHSYREPSWREQYLMGPAFFSATMDVEPEVVDAYEFSYIRKNSLTSFFKINTFYLQNKDQIHAQNATHTFKNNGDNDLYGVEVEYKNNITRADQVYFNYSYVDGKNVGDKLASSARNIAKAYYIHNINNSLAASITAKYIDEKNRIEADTREDVDAYSVFDLSINYQHKSTGIDANLSVKNLFDNTYYLPSPEDTYPEDFEQEGRAILFAVKKKF